MESLNFEFLRSKNHDLADLGGFAEQYAHSDPASALVKLRLFGESLIGDFFVHFKIPSVPKASFLELLQAMDAQRLVPAVVLDKLHALRMHGNRAAHGSGSHWNPEKSMWVLKEAFDLGKWFMVAVHGDKSVADQVFQPPDIPEAAESSTTPRRSPKLAAQEAEMLKMLQERQAARSQAPTTEPTIEVEQKILVETSNAADVLSFDEATTRQLLIDQQLVQAGWDVAPGEDSTEAVGKEVPLVHTDGTNGRADYVLWDDDGKPLGVVEAKRAALDAEKGRAQAKMYADGLEAEYGQRPVIFYTNGHDIYIWDDAKGDVPRRIYGFHSRDSLQYCLWKTQERQPLAELGSDPAIAGWPFQMEAVTRVAERFDSNRRKALIVQATGTGKTRVAIALAELLIRARWVKRVLFLCDRRELRKQAYNAFGEYLESENRVYVTAATAQDRMKSIYLATYPAMMKCYQNFDVGFFDLVIADESHRSIYNRYRDLFLYFDGLQLGLTATPRSIITHDTYRIFDCENNDPTSHYSYNDAIGHVPPYLAHFEVTSHTTKFLRDGIHFDEMSPAQKQQLEEQVEEAGLVDFSRERVDKDVFNKDTDRRILRNLMENGKREASGQHIGKTIVFARDHNHAVQLQKLFEEMYPQYMKPRKEFCAVIDNYIERAEQLIDDFKGDGSNDNLYVAISVDMLDTGIDVPEIVNLVFAKPVKSYVKFWQMIGRGTRLCRDLFGAGQDKESFCIFDHWGNFDYFGMNPPEAVPTVPKSLMQAVFEARLDIGEAALTAQDLPALQTAVELIERDVRALPDATIGVREKWHQVKTVLQPGVIEQFDAATIAVLRMEIAPLMQWCDLSGREDAYRLDRLIARMQACHLQRSGTFDDLRGELQEQVSQLPVNLAQVQAKIDVVTAVGRTLLWQYMDTPEPAGAVLAEEDQPYDATGIPGATPTEKLEHVRRELRGIMHCRAKPKTVKPRPLEIDVTDTEEESQREIVRLEGLDLAAYRHRVEHALREILDQSPVLQRIKAGQPVDDKDIQPLIEEIMAADPTLYVDDLLIHFPNQNNRLDLAIRQIIGLDAEAVDSHFTGFVHKYPALTSHQMRFLALIQKHIVNYGKLEIAKLYEDPFTQVHIEGVDGVFTSDKQVDDLLELITEINQLAVG